MPLPSAAARYPDLPAGRPHCSVEASRPIAVAAPVLFTADRPDSAQLIRVNSGSSGPLTVIPVNRRPGPPDTGAVKAYRPLAGVSGTVRVLPCSSVSWIAVALRGSPPQLRPSM